MKPSRVILVEVEVAVGHIVVGLGGEAVLVDRPEARLEGQVAVYRSAGRVVSLDDTVYVGLVIEEEGGHGDVDLEARLVVLLDEDRLLLDLALSHHLDYPLAEDRLVGQLVRERDRAQVTLPTEPTAHYSPIRIQHVHLHRVVEGLELRVDRYRAEPAFTRDQIFKSGVNFSSRSSYKGCPPLAFIGHRLLAPFLKTTENSSLIANFKCNLFQIPFNPCPIRFINSIFYHSIAVGRKREHLLDERGRK
jgi:hypothetical protein